MTFTRRSFLCSGAALTTVLAVAPEPPRLPRRDCFLGMHFDLHPSEDDTALGRDVTDEMVNRFLEKVRPDFVQYDCKGHVGWLGYPSKVGTSAPGIVKDSLAVWRRATARRGVSLFIHFSGVWDSLAVARHSEWSRVRPDGKPDEHQTSTFGPYVDKLMIPQLLEASEKYDLDGAWIDGECWATNPDYCEAAAAQFREKTGVHKLPTGPKDEGWLAFLELNREQFRRYVRHYLDILHTRRPGFQVASNWLYSTFVPEKPDLPVDYLSGDYLGNASISTARMEARYLTATGKPWDLMAWGFQNGGPDSPGPVHKSAVQLCQEASVVLGQGGGFQIYYQPTRAGKIDDRHIEVMSRVAQFCRARQRWSHKSEPVPQVGVLFSGRTLYRSANRLFGGWGKSTDPARGIIDALLAAHYSVDVLPDWNLERAERFPAIVVPDWKDIGEEAHSALARYAKQGGALLVVGAQNATLFAKDLGIVVAGPASEQEAYVPGSEVFANLRGLWADVNAGNVRVLAHRYPTYDSSRDVKIAAVFAAVGRGKIACIPGPLGAVYAGSHAPAAHEFLHTVLGAIFEPAVELDAPATVEVALRRKAGRTLLHLTNTTAMQVAAEYAAIDFVPAVGPLGIALRVPQRPARVTWEPVGKSLSGKWENGRWRGTIDRLDVHGILVLEG